MSFLETVLEYSDGIITLEDYENLLINENNQMNYIAENMLLENFNIKEKINEIIKKILKAINIFKQFVKKIIRKIKDLISSKKTDKAIKIVKVEKLDKETLKNLVNKKLEIKEASPSPNYMSRVIHAANYAIDHNPEILLIEVLSSKNQQFNAGWFESYINAITVNAENINNNDKVIGDAYEKAAEKIKSFHDFLNYELDDAIDAKAKNFSSYTFETILQFAARGEKVFCKELESMEKYSDRLENIINKLKNEVSKYDENKDKEKIQELRKVISSCSFTMNTISQYSTRIKNSIIAYETFSSLIIGMNLESDKELV